MATDTSDDGALDFSDEEYRYSSDADIDPALTRGAPPGGSTAAAPSRWNALDLDDADFPLPIPWTDDDGSDGGHDDLDDGYTLRDNLKAASGFRVRKKRISAQGFRRRAMRHAGRANDPELRDHMSRANEAFVRGDLSGAWRHYSEVIQRDSRNFNAYKTLGEICQIRGNTHKCCFFWLLAAESGEADADFWGLVADMSAQLGHVDQAVHCYTQAIAKSDGVPWHYVCERALLYKEKKHYVRALEGFQKLLAAYPLEAAAVRHLASVYVEQKRYNDAVGLYMRVLDSNLHPPPGREYVVFDWTELHITCELLAAQEAWASGARLIRLVARWKQNRSDEAWWDEHDDAEFTTPRRLAYVRAKRPTACALLMARDYSLPIDIRFKLGCFRLELGQKNEAVEHFGYLFQQEDKSEVLDLFYEAGAGLEAHGHYAEAVWFLKYLFDNDANTELDLLLGKCLLETDSFRDAKTVLMKTLKRDPANVDAKLTLIEALYHTNEMDLATELMEDVAKSHVPRLPERLLETPHAADAADADPHDNLALIKNSSYYKKIRKNDLDASDRQAIEENATRVVRDKFTRMSRLQQAIDQRHDAAVSAWLKLASQLIEMFVEVRTFFPKNRKTVFKGIAIYKRKKSLAFDDKLHRIRDLFEGYADAENSRIVMTSRTEFRGLDYDTWLWVFVQYAYLLRHFKNDLKEATETIDLASNVSVFKQDKTRSMLLRIARLALGIRQQDYAISVANNIRYFLTSSQFSPSSYDFFMCCFGSGVGAWAVFSNYNHQKFFLRQIKAYDSMLFSSKVSGSAQLTIDVDSFKTNREHPHLLYIYACLLGSNRTFSSPIVYLTRAYRQYYNDPTICFVLGLAHVHRSMQRNSGNRHIQLLQGISYLLEYKSAREQGATVYEKQEIEYNFGRLFHMIGLPTLAVRHYEKVLSYHEQLRNDLDYDLLMEAAYNLSLIYIISGNSMLAKEITDTYLTV